MKGTESVLFLFIVFLTVFGILITMRVEHLSQMLESNDLENMFRFNQMQVESMRRLFSLCENIQDNQRHMQHVIKVFLTSFELDQERWNLLNRTSLNLDLPF
jgi:hypothetical protein